MEIRDATSGYWALDDLALEVFSKHLPTDIADANVRVLASRHGIEMRECRVRMGERTGGESMHRGPAALVNLVMSLHALCREAKRPL